MYPRIYAVRTELRRTRNDDGLRGEATVESSPAFRPVAANIVANRGKSMVSGVLQWVKSNKCLIYFVWASCGNAGTRPGKAHIPARDTTGPPGASPVRPDDLP